MANTDEEFNKLSWRGQVADMVNGNRDRIIALEEQVAKLMGRAAPRTVDDLAGNNRKTDDGRT